MKKLAVNDLQREMNAKFISKEETVLNELFTIMKREYFDGKKVDFDACFCDSRFVKTFDEDGNEIFINVQFDSKGKEVKGNNHGDTHVENLFETLLSHFVSRKMADNSNYQMVSFIKLNIMDGVDFKNMVIEHVLEKMPVVLNTVKGDRNGYIPYCTIVVNNFIKDKNREYHTGKYNAGTNDEFVSRYLSADSEGFMTPFVTETKLDLSEENVKKLDRVARILKEKCTKLQFVCAIYQYAFELTPKEIAEVLSRNEGYHNMFKTAKYRLSEVLGLEPGFFDGMREDPDIVHLSYKTDGRNKIVADKASQAIRKVTRSLIKEGILA